MGSVELTSKIRKGVKVTQDKDQGSKRGGRPKAAGKHTGKISMYYQVRYPRNKLRRILRHNGEELAREWARNHGAEGILRQLMREGVAVRRS